MKPTALFSIILLLLTSCAQSTNNENSKTDKSHSKKETPTTTAETEELSLNNGDKWRVNPEMMVYIAASEALLQNFEPESDGDYADLAAGLEQNKNLLISACTMKGPAHDVLHHWLMPHIGNIDNLAEAETTSDKDNAVDALRESFRTFHTYFR